MAHPATRDVPDNVEIAFPSGKCLNQTLTFQALVHQKVCIQKDSYVVGDI